jgi:site-specific DNA-cytosine methylase
LENIKPKVFWGENAPRLFSAKGEPVANRLYEIGRKHGYSLNLYYTESILHGISQKRPRTFYFLTRGDQAPIFPWYRKEMEPSETILERPVADDDPMNLPSPHDPYDNPWLQYCLHMSDSKTIKEFYEKIDETTNCITKCDRGFGTTLNEVADWMDDHGHNKMAEKARRMQKKLDQGLGYWAYGITLAKGKIPSFISSQPHDMINPFTEKYLNVRESLRIMGLPDDFNMVGDARKSLNHICQNVPVTTAQDMTKSIIKYLDGEVEFASSNYIKQNNKKQEVIEKHFEANTTALDSFFNLQNQ